CSLPINPESPPIVAEPRNDPASDVQDVTHIRRMASVTPHSVADVRLCATDRANMHGGRPKSPTVSALRPPEKRAARPRGRDASASRPLGRILPGAPPAQPATETVGSPEAAPPSFISSAIRMA